MEKNTWTNFLEFESIPEHSKTKINAFLTQLHSKIYDLEKSSELSKSNYETIIKNVENDLESSNSKNLELQMEFLKLKTDDNINNPKTHDNSMIERLKHQVDFLINNAGSGQEDLVELLNTQSLEIYELKKSMRTNFESIKEYQTFIYKKSEDMFKLEKEITALKIKNGLLEEYKLKYDSLFLDFIKISEIVGELKIKNNDLMLIAKSNKNVEILENIISLKNRFESFEPEKVYFEIIERIKNAETNLYNVSIEKRNHDILRMRETIKNLYDRLNILKYCIGDIENNIECLYTFISKIIELASFNKHNRDNISECDLDEFNLMKKEIIILEKKLENNDSGKHLILVNQKLADENKKLVEENNTLNYLKIENKKIISEIELKREENVNLEKIVDACNSNIERLNLEINELHNSHTGNYNEDYVKNLEEQLNYYKEDISIINERYNQYKRLLESFNIEKNKEYLHDLKENILIKDNLINNYEKALQKYKNIIDSVL